MDVVRGLIRPGRKIAIAGAKFSSIKGPTEVLDAYKYGALRLNGNGTHFAPWHARLGFQSQAFIATLGSLTPDGGNVPVAEFVVEKTYPIAYFEYTPVPDGPPGEKKREGPYGEAEEAELHDQWLRRREAANAKVREEFEKRWSRWEILADRVERAIHPEFKVEDDEDPWDVGDLYDDLMDKPPDEIADFINLITVCERYWLVKYLRNKAAFTRKHSNNELDMEAAELCPPRDTRSFRIVAVRDSRTDRRPANRQAHLCVWDVLSVCVVEGAKPGAIEVGQHFLVTNLIPMQQKSWMGNNKDDMVYLSTTKRSRYVWLR